MIAGVFYRRGLIEQWGRGTQKIVNWCLAAGQPEPEFEEQTGAVVVRFFSSGYHAPLRVGHELTDRHRRILLILGEGGEWSFGNVYARLQDLAALFLAVRRRRESFSVAYSRGGRTSGSTW